MSNAITNFQKINNFVQKLSDEEIIRATDKNLTGKKLTDQEISKNKSDQSYTHLYVRDTFIDKLFQKLTNWTNGAKHNQKLAKNLILNNLDSLPENLKNDQFVSSAIDDIKNKLKSASDKDITAGMIRKDLEKINQVWNLIQLDEKNSKIQTNNPLFLLGKKLKEEKLNSSVNNESTKNIQLSLDTNNTDEKIDQTKSESETEFFDANSEESEDFLIDEKIVGNPVDAKAFEDNSSQITNATIEVAIITNHFDETSDFENAKNNKFIVSEANESKNSAPSVSSSKTETKNSETANPHLESLKSEWNPADNGYIPISELFSITSGIPTSSMIAQAYLLPNDLDLKFQGASDQSKTTSENISFKTGKHTYPSKPIHEQVKDSKRDDKYDVTRNYLHFQAERPASRMHIDKLTVTQKNNLKEELEMIYRKNISAITIENNRLNHGNSLESLVITPIFQDLARPSETEVEALVKVVRDTQKENPNLKINISTVRDEHKKLIEDGYIKLATSQN